MCCYPSTCFRGSSHLCTGQEAIAVGVLHALREDDFVLSTHRGHGHALARGVDPYVMFSEIMGARRAAAGVRGSMHLADMGHKFVGEDPVVGSNSPIAAGLALALKQRGATKWWRTSLAKAR